MPARDGMRILVLTLTLLFWGDVGLAQRGGQEGASHEDLEKRIAELERIVAELKQELSARKERQAAPQTEAPPAPPPQAAPAADSPSRRTRISGLMFGDYYWLARHHEPALEDRNGFWFRRIYLTFDQPISESLDARLRFEMNSAGDFSSSTRLEPFVKDAYLRWKVHDRHQAYLGLSSTPTWEVTEGFWGYRSLEKTLLDLQRMGSSRDFGLALKGSLDAGRKLDYHFMIGNGSGTGTETNQGKKVLFSLALEPAQGWLLQFYTDWEGRPGGTDRNTWQGFAGYQGERGRLGVQLVRQIRHRRGGPELDLDGLSLFGILHITPRSSLLARYDRMFDPNPDGDRIAYLPFDPEAESNFFLVGVDFRVHERFSLMPNLEIVRYERRPDGSRPGTDLVPRLTFFYRY